MNYYGIPDLLPTDAGTGPLAAPKGADVLLETMAPLPHQGEKPA
jgi:hypothetical protein